MTNPVRELLIGLQFLTRIPVNLSSAPHRAEIGRSILYYPVIGLLLGLVLAAPLAIAAALGSNIPAGPTAGCMVILWIALTGALHIDGLADAADGWLGGYGNRERTLEIMKDPRSGAAAIAAVLAVILAKFGALLELVEQANWLAILFAPVIGRWAVLVLVLTTPYTATSSLGADLASDCPKRPALVIAIGLPLALIFIVPTLFFAIAVALVGLWLLRRIMLQRLGGATGDTTGASVECVEMLALMAAAFTG